MGNRDKAPLVSICVPVYGVEKYVGKCFETLFSQTYKNIEYVVVNDCTPDNSINIIKELVRHYPERINQLHIIDHEHNRGLAAARNTAVDNAHGEFLIHVDSDDYVEPSLVEKLVDKQRETNADIVSSGYSIVEGINAKRQNCTYNGSPHQLALDMFMRKQPAHVWGRFIRRNIYTYNSIHCEEGINMGEDFQVIPILVFHSKALSSVDEPLYVYRFMSEESYSKKFNKKRLLQEWRSFDIIKEFFLQYEGKFNNQIAYAELRTVVMYLVFAARYSNKDYYVEARARLLKIDKKYWKEMPLPMRIQLWLSGNFHLMSIYSNFSTFIKHKIQ